MRRAIIVALGTGAAIASAAAIGIGAAVDGPAPALGRDGYRAALQSIQAERATALARCASLAGAEAEYCRAEASASEMVRVADLEASYRRTQQSAREAQRARIEARYQLDRAQCASLRGLKRDRCLVQAHARKGRSMLDAAAPYEVRF